MLHVLVDKYPAAVTQNAIMFNLWPHQDLPEYWRNIVKIVALRLRRKTGLNIKGVSWTGGYQLVNDEEIAA